LLVGPALSFESEQINVRSSTRAMSLGSERGVVTAGPKPLIQFKQGSGSDHVIAKRLVFVFGTVHLGNA
jgi:hypothetical protein